ncbi:MAG: PhoH family protein, partial [Deltaproteobacteria bacterium]|nr:PhoH family protein [Deltaproteobacteria bacterium]
MRKTYILDTNVLLHNPRALFAFREDRVVVPLAVIEEIDDQKKRQDEIGKNARMSSRILDGLRSGGQLSRGILLDGGGELRVEVNHQDALAFPRGLDPGKYDNRILALAHNLQKDGGTPVILVTKDLNLRIKADVMGIAAEDFFDERVDDQDRYTGVREVRLE